jgi:protein SCO1/2
VDQLLLLCFHYDPLSGQYGLAIMRTIRGIAIAFVVCLLAYVAISLRHELKAQRDAARAVDATPRAATD